MTELCNQTFLPLGGLGKDNGGLGKDAYRDILKQYWGYDDFRGIQRDIIESISAGRDTLGLMPTGGGKSITFQVPALLMDGVCIVITPLIALMKDQVQHLRDRGIKAAAVYSGMSRAEIIKTLENAVFGAVKILYVSPERLGSDIFQVKLRHMKVSFITVDEAHCISQWGYDFRPAYLQIANIRKIKPEAPVLALTATATPRVIDDIQFRLEFHEKNVFRMSFERKNLAYVVRKTDNKDQELIHILKSMQGCAIVYARNRKRTKNIALLLEDNGLSATFYHAGLEPSIKDARQKAWQNDEKRIMVATTAFGMGIDKSDVRIVIHMDCPDSIEAYFQEAGRAGRDGKRAYAVLLWSNSDKRKLSKRVTDTYPPKEYVQDVYEHLAYYYQVGVGSGAGHTFSFEIDKFCSIYRYYPVTVHSALRLLENAGYLDYEEDPDASARLMFLIGRNELYRLFETTPHEEAVLTAILRNYGGLFTDYGFIDEGLVALQAGIGEQEVYQILKTLSQRHILNFIPRRKTPYITYTRDREDAKDVIIPRAVYEDRKEQYIKRVEAVITYATNDNVCRSRHLLRYFGEKNSHDCDICDVCVNSRQRSLGNHDADHEMERAAKAILDFLGDGKRHHVTELYDILLPKDAIDDALHYLMQEELMHLDGIDVYR